MKHPILIALSLFFISITACDSDNPVSQAPTISTPEELTADLATIFANSSAPGFSVSVVANETVLYTHAFGNAHLTNQKSFATTTVQPIGSISKTFIAAALVKAIDEGYFTLETDINSILPIELVNPKQPEATIKVKHLVTHTSSLVDNSEIYLATYRILPGEDMGTSGAEILNDWLDFEQREAMPLDELMAEYYLEDGDGYFASNFAATAPGTQWSYSNLASSLAAFLIESATGMSFAEYVSSKIFTPLGMAHSSYQRPETGAATLYWDKNTPLPAYASDSYPDGSVHTNAEDMSKYLLDMMNGAKGKSTLLFSQEGYQMLFTPLLADEIVPSVLGQNQGIFWFLNNETIKHDGSDPGVTTNIEFDRNGESGFVLLTNMDASTDEHTQQYLDLQHKVAEAITSFLHEN